LLLASAAAGAGSVHTGVVKILWQWLHNNTERAVLRLNQSWLLLLSRSSSKGEDEPDRKKAMLTLASS
jgi:hypothetical protein